MTRLVLLILICGLMAACNRGSSAVRAETPPPAAGAAAATPAIPHGDHNPHYGGIVLMNGDLHFEVVLARDGRYRVYFSDAVRNELPAATAVGVTITVTQKGKAPEPVALHIDDSGESWTGSGSPIADPNAMARIAYSVHGEPYFIDVPVPR